MATVLVAASSGFVGQAVISSLLALGHTVRAGSRKPDAATLPAGATAVRFDYADATSWAPAMEGVDRLFVLSPAGYAAAHELVGPFLEYALALPSLQRVVAMTAQGVEFSDEIPLRRIELQIERSGKPWSVVRPSWFHQNFQSYWGYGIENIGEIQVPAADARSGFIDAADIGASAAAALTHDHALGKAWVLTGPEALTYGEAAAILSEATGRTIRYNAISDEQFHAGLLAGGLPADYAGLLTSLFGAVRMGAAAHLTDHVQQLTGKAPRTLAAWAAEAYRGA